MKKLFCVFFIALTVGLITVSGQSVVKATMFRDHGLCASWDRSGSNRIAYAQKNQKGFYEVHLANPDGRQDTCLTCNTPLLPHGHNGSPNWHPSGKWLVITCEKPVHKGGSFPAMPGLGGYTDIWLINTTCTKAYKLFNPANDIDHGIIMPHFSNDGKHLVWTNRKTRPNLFLHGRMFGYWTINVADFSFDENGVPHISNIKELEPAGSAFYETYGYSPDDKKIIFCSDMKHVSAWNEQIYTMSPDGTDVKQLTDGNYNEHAFYTPDGKHIVWMTNAGTKGGTDWWTMKADGGDKKRLTYFNDKNSPEYVGKAVWCCFGSFNADGGEFVGDRQVSLISQEGQVLKVELKW